MRVSLHRFQELAVAVLVICAIYAAVRAQDHGPVQARSTLERIELEHLKTVAATRQRFAAERRVLPGRLGLKDLRAVFHVHAEDSPHTGGTLEEVLEACRPTGVRVVFLTDHARKESDPLRPSWRGLHNGVLFFPGAETEGLLSFPVAKTSQPVAKRDQYIAEVLRGGGLVFLSHLEERLQDAPAGLTGYEIYNAHAEIKDEAVAGLSLLGALCDTKQWATLSYRVKHYGDEWMGALQTYPRLYLSKWDHDSEQRHLTGIAANDAHHNQIYRVVVRDEFSAAITSVENQDLVTLQSAQQPELAPLLRGRKRGEVLLQLDLDPYERSFRNTNTHILAGELSEESIREAVRRGRAYVAHEWLAEATGFELIAKGVGRTYEMGDSVELTPGLRVETTAPLNGWFQLIRNGKSVAKVKGTSHSFPIQAPGVYRVEVWLEVDGEERPWIYSNPVWVGEQPWESSSVVQEHFQR